MNQKYMQRYNGYGNVNIITSILQSLRWSNKQIEFNSDYP